MPPVSPLQVTVVTKPEPEHAPDQEYEVMAYSLVALADHVQVSCPGPGLVGALIVGAEGAVGGLESGGDCKASGPTATSPRSTMPPNQRAA